MGCAPAGIAEKKSAPRAPQRIQDRKWALFVIGRINQKIRAGFFVGFVVVVVPPGFVPEEGFSPGEPEGSVVTVTVGMATGVGMRLLSLEPGSSARSGT